jgi:hypothetical protein
MSLLLATATSAVLDSQVKTTRKHDSQISAQITVVSRISRPFTTGQFVLHGWYLRRKLNNINQIGNRLHDLVRPVCKLRDFVTLS